MRKQVDTHSPVGSRSRLKWLSLFGGIACAVLGLAQVLPDRDDRSTDSAASSPQLTPVSTVVSTALQPEIPHVPTPEEEMATFEMAEGWEISLFADESDGVINPIQMTWDPQGRLWVCCAPSYPHAQPGETPSDYLLILEDTDGDGHADRSWKFVEDLYIPTGFELGDGGAYVASAPHLWHVRDTDGDGRADEREILLTGFGTEDSHHSISTFRWGPGGRLYFQEGTFFHSQIETPHGRVSLVYGGMYELQPRTKLLSVFMNSRVSNPWGHVYDRWGEQVMIDNPRLSFPASLSGSGRSKTTYHQIGTSGSGKTCGGEWLSGRHLPDELSDVFILPSYQSHRLLPYHLEEQGAGYVSRSGEAIMRSTSAFYRPVDIRMGPEGALYIADWFNPIIGHTQHDARDPRRDQGHGRIWRMTYRDRPLVERPQLVGTALPELLDYLKVPEDWTRHQVKRMLYEMDADQVEPALNAWVAGLDTNDPEYMHHLLEALWSYQVIERPHPEVLREVLAAEDHMARMAALRVLRYWYPVVDDRLELLSTAIEDEHARVRLEALLTLSFVPEAQSVVIAAHVLDHPMDRFLEEALTNALEGLQPYFEPVYLAGELEFDKEEHRVRMMAGIDVTLAVRPLIEAIEAGYLPPESRDSLLAPMGTTANVDAVTDVWAALTDVPQEGRLDSDSIVAVLHGLEVAGRDRGLSPESAMRNLQKMFQFRQHQDQRVRLAASRLELAWNPGNADRYQGMCRNTLVSNEQSMADRVEMALLVATFSPQLYSEIVRPLLQPRSPVEQKYLAAIVYAAARHESAEERAAEVLSVDPQGADPRYLVEAFVRQRGGARRLGEALQATAPHADAATLVLRYLNEVGEQDEQLVAAVTPQSDTATLTQQLLEMELATLTEEITTRGNAANGRQVFEREGFSCVKCHTVNAEHPLIGPDLGQIGRSPVEYVLESLLEPSTVIKEEYVNVGVFTVDGRSVSGILKYQDDQIITLHSGVDGSEVSIPADEIDELVELSSLMPAGLADQMTRQEFLDLMKFLTECQ